jgi:hypothetical protein
VIDQRRHIIPLLYFLETEQILPMLSSLDLLIFSRITRKLFWKVSSLEIQTSNDFQSPSSEYSLNFSNGNILDFLSEIEESF